ncbi:MAG TPA: hypothetical protein VGI22_24900 [Xanthobacteraceae bacterium]
MRRVHGTTGRGDGPAAAQAEHKPADLTAEHSYAHRDGDLFGWITDGIDDAMPAFREVLNETARWNVIDFIHANADAAHLRASGGQIGPVGYPTPDFSASCRGDTIASLAELRGYPVHVVSAPAGSIEALEPIVERDRALGVTTIAAVNGLVGSDAMPCVSDEPALLETMGIYGGIDAERMPHRMAHRCKRPASLPVVPADFRFAGLDRRQGLQASDPGPARAAGIAEALYGTHASLGRSFQNFGLDDRFHETDHMAAVPPVLPSLHPTVTSATFGLGRHMIRTMEASG